METPTLLPDLLNERISPGEVLLELRVPVDLAYCVGHFERIAIVPGVAQIHWAAHFAARHFPWAAAFRHMEAVKFKELLLPGQTLKLRLQGRAEKSGVNFSYFSDAQEFSSGRLYFQSGDV